MDKALGQNMSADKRVTFLKDNCERIESLGYMKQFTQGELAEFKDEVSELAIELNDIAEEKKEMMKEFKARMEPLQERQAELLKNIKTKAEFVKEDCFKFVDHDARQVGYYNAKGILVEERPARPDEAQLTIKLHKVTGTDNQ